MNIYIDESGSINNHDPRNNFFVIALVHADNTARLGRAYKRFISSHIDRLKELDTDRFDSKGRLQRPGGKMFRNGKFHEIKGAMLDRDLKSEFIHAMTDSSLCEIFYIKLDNRRLSDTFCDNTSRAFNYSLRFALEQFIGHSFLQDHECHLQLDERNERIESKYFLENYLNTELHTSGAVSCCFDVRYFDSCNNRFVQIADVFANMYHAELMYGGYSEILQELQDRSVIKEILEYPLASVDADISSC